MAFIAVGKPFRVAAVAAVALAAGFASAAQRSFVLVDRFLQMPAVFYRLDEGWEGMGWVTWNMRSDTKLSTSAILFSPSRHMVVQELGPMQTMAEIFTPQRLALFQNPDLLARQVAAELNSGIVVPGLAGFVAKGGRFTQDVPPFAKLLAESLAKGSVLAHVNAFRFEGSFQCQYGGVPCEARYTAAMVVNVQSVQNPRVPKIGTSNRIDVRLTIAPPGRLDEAANIGGRMLASAFVNRQWLARQDSTLAALLKGTEQGRAAGWELWRKSQAETAETLNRVRIMKSEEIREVKTVDNPFSPGTKIERPAFFNKAWINSREDILLLSDRSLEPNIIRGLMEQGEWQAIN
ncbi:MAG: hypothetical protein J6334_06515 [Kiritimatiellae bacterium]|nr:hypothetical protein [Kiritimatiellia bacterium]